MIEFGLMRQLTDIVTRDGCSDGANPLPGALAIAASGLASGNR